MKAQLMFNQTNKDSQFFRPGKTFHPQGLQITTVNKTSNYNIICLNPSADYFSDMLYYQIFI